MRKKIAVYHPSFMGGGAEAVSLWMLEALKEKYDLTLFTATPLDWQKMNLMYGTSLTSNCVTTRPLVPHFLNSTCNVLIANSTQFRMLCFHLLIRYLKEHQDEYDLLLSSYNAIDLGQQGIQYIHWTKVVEGGSFYHKISGFSEKRLKDNFSLANSHFVAQRVKNFYGIDSTVVYPPVVLDSPDIPWADKEDAFICSGRIAKAKQTHKVIQVLKAVRKQGFNIKLHITGGGGGFSEWKYTRFVKKLIRENADWVTLHENLKYKDYVKVLAQCKYGIHVKQEPFGISIAEMVKAGAIPFVKNQGGQIEIVGAHNDALFFDKAEKAADKIVAVLGDTHLQEKLVASLQDQQQLFSTHRFMTEISGFIDDYFATDRYSFKK